MISSRKLTLMSGISGSGKSTEVAKRFPISYKPMLGKDHEDNWKTLADINLHQNQPAILVSADHYFFNEEGRYVFNPKYLGLAHGACLRAAIEACQKEVPNLVVDNTNTTNEEMAPYIAVGLAYGYVVEVVTLMCANLEEVDRCALRNLHGAPNQAVQGMHQRIQQRTPPYHWRPEFGVTFTTLPVFP